MTVLSMKFEGVMEDTDIACRAGFISTEYDDDGDRVSIIIVSVKVETYVIEVTLGGWAGGGEDGGEESEVEGMRRVGT
jgi:hypothetical protein